MKKKGILILIGLISFNLICCTNNDKNLNNNRKEEEYTSTSNSKIDQNNITQTDTNSDIKTSDKSKVTNNTNNNSYEAENKTDYEIAEEIYSKKNIKIKYPQIKNLNDSKKSDLINKILKSQALAIINYYDLSNSNAILNISYDIQFQNNANLSIVYKGDFNSGNSPYPTSVFYTTNINLIKGKSIRLKDYANVNEVFNKLRDSNKSSNIITTQELAQAQTEYISNIDDSTLKNMLENADFYENNGAIQFPEVFSYIKNDNIIIGISVPHAIGDYAQFVVKK